MKTDMVAWQCDAPLCTTTRNAPKGEMPEGLGGTVDEESLQGGIGVEWYACSLDHVGAAVAYALSQEWDR